MLAQTSPSVFDMNPHTDWIQNCVCNHGCLYPELFCDNVIDRATQHGRFSGLTPADLLFIKWQCFTPTRRPNIPWMGSAGSQQFSYQSFTVAPVASLLFVLGCVLRPVVLLGQEDFHTWFVLWHALLSTAGPHRSRCRMRFQITSN